MESALQVEPIPVPRAEIHQPPMPAPWARPTILLAAATPWESEPLRKRLRLRPSDIALWGGGRAGACDVYNGTLGARNVLLVRTGIGPIKTAEALGGLGEPSDPGVAISSGLAGALQPGIGEGDLVADLRGAPAEWPAAAVETAGICGLRLHLGALISSETVVSDPAKKRDLGRARRAIAVDMESDAVRGWARARGWEFLAVRAVLDTMDRRFPDGIHDVDPTALGLARLALGRWRDLPALLQFGLLQRRAMRSLARFMEIFLKQL